MIQETEKELWDTELATAIDPASVRLGSIDVVEYLQAKHPTTEFSLLLGMDTYNDLMKGMWKGGLALLECLPIVVVEREGVSIDSIKNHDGVTFVQIPSLNDTSSTKARATSDEAELSTLVVPSVLAYMKTHRLYAFGQCG